ncbi:phage tail protein [Exiguobacterium artemiae]
MSYVAKTDWKGNDPVTEGDINRWELGIQVAHEELGQKIDVSERGVPEGIATLGEDGKVTPSELEDASITKKGQVQLSNATDSTSEILAATPKAVKTVADQVAQNSTKTEILSDKTDDLKTAKTNKDANGIFTTITYRRKSNDSLFATSVLSGGTSPSYTTRTVTYYEANGTTIRKTVTFTLSYDADGALVSEV